MNSSDIIRHCAEKISRDTTLDGDVLSSVAHLNKALRKAGTDLPTIIEKYNNAEDTCGYEDLFRQALSLNKRHEAEIKRLRDIAIKLECEANNIKKENEKLKKRCRALTESNIALKAKTR